MNENKLIHLNPKIGAYIYKTILPYNFKERIDLSGMTDFDVNEIKISQFDKCGNQKVEINIFQTFIHEIIHCIDHCYNCNKLDEDTTERISQGLTQFLLDNYELKLKKEEIKNIRISENISKMFEEINGKK